MKLLNFLVIFFLFGCQTSISQKSKTQDFYSIPLDFYLNESETYVVGQDDSSLIITRNLSTITEKQINACVDEVNRNFQMTKLSFYVRSVEYTRYEPTLRLAQVTEIAANDEDGILVYVECGFCVDLKVAGETWLPQEMKSRGIWMQNWDIANTLTHELGHYFGLRHTFDPSEDIEDTYNEEQWKECFGTPYISYPNFMNYTNAQERVFSPGQISVINDGIKRYRPKLVDP